MGKSKKKAMHSQKEEQQAKKVMMTMGVIAIVLVIAMFVALLLGLIKSLETTCRRR